MDSLPQVLVGAHTLLANGGIIAPAGTALVALAAKKHAVPLVVLVVSRHLARTSMYAASCAHLVLQAHGAQQQLHCVRQSIYVCLLPVQGLHKLSPMFPHDPAVTFNDFKSPGSVLEYDALAETLAASRPDDDSTSEFTCVAARSCSASGVLFWEITSGCWDSHVCAALST